MSPAADRRVILAGDIGGTKTNLGLFSMDKGRPRMKVLQTFPSKEAACLEDIVHRFLEKHPTNLAGACFGIAGPVQGGKSKTTNLPWVVDEARIRSRFQLEQVQLLNDVAATARAIPLLTSRDFYSLNRRKSSKGGNLGLVAPGTGLGLALMVWEKDHYVTVPSEGGHVEFAPVDEREMELWGYLRRQFGHVSVERILSGPGFFNIYSSLKETGRFREPDWLAQGLREDDPAKVIAESAFLKGEPICLEVLDIFVAVLGAVAGNLALTGFTTGGVYLGGGIPPKILSKLREGRFMASFTNKGRFQDWASRIPVRVILNDKAALMGAAECALTQVFRGETRRLP